MTKLQTHIVTKLQSQKLNSKTQLLMKLKNWNCYKTKNQILTIPNKKKHSKLFFGKDNLTPQQPIRWTLGSVLIYCDVLFNKLFCWRKFGHRICLLLCFVTKWLVTKLYFVKCLRKTRKKHFFAKPWTGPLFINKLTEGLILFLPQLKGASTSKQLNLALSD